MMRWVVVAVAVRAAEPSADRSAANRRAAAKMTGLIQPDRQCGRSSL